MLKGHTYSQQLFRNEAFRLFIDTFLQRNSGIILGCELSNTSNSITIKDGWFCIRGGFLQEEGGTTINVTETATSYCKLVCEIDLSKINTNSNFEQGQYKIIKSTSSYPTLTQQDITNGGDVYQFEFAQFKTGANGITDFVDTRSFLSFEGIYNKVLTDTKNATNETEIECRAIIEKIQQELVDVENGSAYLLKAVADATYFSKDSIKVGTQVPEQLADGEIYLQVF